jgi:hypothetical protein
VCLSILIFILLVLYTNSIHDDIVDGMTKENFRFIFIVTLLLTLAGLYFYNFKKTNWYFAIFNTILQPLTLPVFVILSIGKLIFFRGNSLTNSATGSQPNISGRSISTVLIERGWIRVYDNNNNVTFSRNVNDKDKLRGYTSSTFTLEQNGWVKVYDIDGNVLSSRNV